jgi:hypothetical protein
MTGQPKMNYRPESGITIANLEWQGHNLEEQQGMEGKQPSRSSTSSAIV